MTAWPRARSCPAARGAEGRQSTPEVPSSPCCPAVVVHASISRGEWGWRHPNGLTPLSPTAHQPRGRGRGADRPHDPARGASAMVPTSGSANPRPRVGAVWDPTHPRCGRLQAGGAPRSRPEARVTPRGSSANAVSTVGRLSRHPSVLRLERQRRAMRMALWSAGAGAPQRIVPHLWKRNAGSGRSTAGRTDTTMALSTPRPSSCPLPKCRWPPPPRLHGAV